MRHINKGMTHKNYLVEYLFNMSVYNPTSVMGKNIRNVCHLYDIKISDLYLMDYNYQKSCLVKKYTIV